MLVPRKPIPIWGAGFKNIQRGSSPGTHRVAPAHSQYPSGVCVHLPGTRTVPGSDGGFRGDGDNPPPPSCPLSPHATRGHEATLGTWQRGGTAALPAAAFLACMQIPAANCRLGYAKPRPFLRSRHGICLEAAGSSTQCGHRFLIHLLLPSPARWWHLGSLRPRTPRTGQQGTNSHSGPSSAHGPGSNYRFLIWEYRQLPVSGPGDQCPRGLVEAPGTGP